MGNEEKKCELCKDLATNVCFDCSIYLCDSCSKFLHEKSTNLKHEREIINPYISMNIKCQKHPKIPVSLFCLDEKSKILNLF